ncbi:pilus assembly protein TadG-related protein [Marinobacter flavimaris]|nr:pilus assembly protein TadG-related protein [Marinobacter flavimaris]
MSDVLLCEKKSLKNRSLANINSLKQRGSILVYYLSLLALLALIISYSFNASRISSEKTRLQNTSDAAAFSVATVESRDLNFKAYTNRAMVANQVAIAQSISIVSWARFIDRFVSNLSHITSFFPPLRAVFAGISSAVSSAVRGLDSAINVVIFGINFLEQQLSNAQQIHHLGTVLMAREIFTNVVKKNDPDVDRSITLQHSLFIQRYLKNHESFTQRYSPEKVTRTLRSRSRQKYTENKNRMDEFRSVTLRSRDGFSRNRTYNWMGTVYIPFDFRVKIQKTGGSELTGSSRKPDEHGNYYTWSAMDTMAFHGSYYRCSWTSGCGWRSWREFLPVAWGAAATGGERPFDFFRGLGGRNRYANSYRVNRWASRLAALEFNRNGSTGVFNGLRAFYDIKEDGLISEAPGVAVLLTKPHGNSGVRTSKYTDFGSGSSNLDVEGAGGLHKNRLSALSQAVPYFSRPNGINVFRRSDRLREYGNLYNPFWQPRLSKLEDKNRMLRLAATLL